MQLGVTDAFSAPQFITLLTDMHAATASPPAPGAEPLQGPLDTQQLGQAVTAVQVGETYSW